MRTTTTLKKRSPLPKMRPLWLVTGVVLMTGCSSTPDGPTSMAALGALSPDISRAAPEQSVGPCGRRYDAEIGVELSLIQRMLDDGKGTADDKFKALEAAGVATVRSTAEIGSKMEEILG